jgi:membrane protease subunit HflK
MAWNEPGGGNRDPWGGKGNDDGPPDLDEVARKLRERMSGLFGGGGKRGGGRPFPLRFVVLLAILAWVLSGIYLVQPAERGVVLRLGKFNTLTLPGPHWYLRGIDKVVLVDVDQLRTVSHRAKMLTKDENIVQVELAVQYQVKDAQEYVFKVRDPDYTLQEATESALREVIGNISMDDFLSGGRGKIVQQTKDLTQEMLDKYQTGLMLTSVNLQNPQPPQEVQDAFEDAIKAQEDEQRYKNQADAYAYDILPRARGDATRLREAANAYREQVVAKANGEASRFLSILSAYDKAPEVTRKRIYLDTMETILSNTSKVVVQVKNGNNLLYLPLDKLMGNRSATTTTLPAGSDFGTSTGTPPGADTRAAPKLRNSSRSEGAR